MRSCISRGARAHTTEKRFHQILSLGAPCSGDFCPSRSHASSILSRHRRKFRAARNSWVNEITPFNRIAPVSVFLLLRHWPRSAVVLMRRWQLCLPDTALVRTASRLSLEQKHAVHDVLLGAPKNSQPVFVASAVFAKADTAGSGSDGGWWARTGGVRQSRTGSSRRACCRERSRLFLITDGGRVPHGMRGCFAVFTMRVCGSSVSHIGCTDGNLSIRAVSHVHMMDAAAHKSTNALIKKRASFNYSLVVGTAVGISSNPWRATQFSQSYSMHSTLRTHLTGTHSSIGVTPVSHISNRRRVHHDAVKRHPATGAA